MKLFFLIAAALTLSTTAAQAEDFSLYYTGPNGSRTPIDAVENLQKLIFANGSMTIVRTDGSTTSLSLSSVDALSFHAEGDAVSIDEVEAIDSSTQKKGVYDLTGRKLNIDLDKEKLSKGCYIVNGKKILVK